MCSQPGMNLRACSIRLAVLTAVVLTTPAALPAQSYTSEGATLGGVAGAIVGGVIGHQNNETPEGALIGGAVGAITGGVLGNARDQQAARQQAYQYHAWQQQQRARAVTLPDVVTMTRSGVDESIIINHIRTHGVRQRLTTHDIINLTQQGVREPVITALQQASEGPATPVYVERPVPRPVVVTPVYRPLPTYAPRSYLHLQFGGHGHGHRYAHPHRHGHGRYHR